MKNLVLIGFMGSGKSSIGRRVAARLNRDFVDIDVVIEQREQRRISEIFEMAGEHYFRRIEAEVVKELAARTDGCVIATGGGVVLNADNLHALRHNGVLIVLWVDPDTAHQRTAHKLHLPLLKAPDRHARVKELFAKREALYRAAGAAVDTRGKLLDQVVEEVVATYRHHDDHSSPHKHA
jgi:shikimate kinase